MVKKVSKKSTKMKKPSKKTPQLNIQNIPSKALPPLKKISIEETKKLNFAGFKFPALHSVEKKPKKSLLKRILKRKR